MKEKKGRLSPASLHFVILLKIVGSKFENDEVYSLKSPYLCSRINTFYNYEGKKTLDNPDDGDDIDSPHRCVRRRAYVRV